jgi:hypothetical protein
MKKYIIIIGEEYWFDVKGEYEWKGKKYTKNYRAATHLLDTLKNNNSKYEYIILNGPTAFVENVNSIGKDKVKAIFFFHDVFSDSILNKMNIMEMKRFLLNLQNNYDIYLYPGIEKTMLFGSKEYYKTLIKNMPYSVLPDSKVYTFKDYQGYKDEKIITSKLYNTAKYLLDKYPKVVIKKGFSYEGKQVKVIDKDLIFDFYDFRDIARRLNTKHFWNIKSSAIDMDIGIDRHYIIQPYNEIVVDKLNEFRVFFYNGHAKYITWQTDFDNLCVNDIENIDDNITLSNDKKYVYNVYDADGNQIDDERITKEFNKNLLIEVLRFSKKVYNDFLPFFWKKKGHPILFRTDISYAIDPIFMDNFSVNIEGMDSKVRFYVNELEIDPTNFFYNNTVCKKNEKITSKYLEILYGELINNYIKNNIF